MHFARRLIDETRLPTGEVALASGFRSIRQFNHAVRATFGRSPTRLRRGAAQASPDGAAGEVVLRLPYRPPFDWESLLGFLALRALPGVECVDEHAYRRVVEIDGDAGWLEVRSDPRAAQLVLRLGCPTSGTRSRWFSACDGSSTSTRTRCESRPIWDATPTSRVSSSRWI